VDVLRAQAAALARQQGEHLGAGAAGAVAGPGELALGVLAPGAAGGMGGVRHPRKS
jgi:hypothetical protein